MAKEYLIYDPRYYYVGLAALGGAGGSLPDDAVDGVVRAALHGYTRRRQARYGLPDRAVAYRDTPRLILLDLRTLGLVAAEGAGAEKRWRLTPDGAAFYPRLRDLPGRFTLRADLAARMLDAFPVAAACYRGLLAVPPPGLMAIPLPRRADFPRARPEDLTGVVAAAVARTAALLAPHAPLDTATARALAAHLGAALPTGLAKGQPPAVVLEAAVPAFFLALRFAGQVGSKPRYEATRTQLAFTGIINYLHPPGAGVDLLYAVARPGAAPPTPVGWYALTPQLGPLWQPAPAWTAASAPFLEALQVAYRAAPHPTGYAEIADVRDRVCLALRWPDYLFDNFLAEAATAAQQGTIRWRIYLDATLAGRRPRLKRAPLELRGGAYNLIRVQQL